MLVMFCCTHYLCVGKCQVVLEIYILWYILAEYIALYICVEKLKSVVLDMMRNDDFCSHLELPTAPMTMTDAMDVVNDKPAAILNHETRFSFV